MVSIHAPGWARHICIYIICSSSRFQFTRPGGRDSTPASPNTNSASFNSRARVGATRARARRPRARARFNSRARVGATSKRPSTSSSKSPFQFTRPGGRDKPLIVNQSIRPVSIHAPGWARLWHLAQEFSELPVSIHAPGWARLPQTIDSCSRRVRFNSRARVGATGCWGRCARRRRRFNSRARVGATDVRRTNAFTSHLFQFTRPGGRDTRGASRSCLLRWVSIHAPGWARRSAMCLASPAECFNSRARVGATRPLPPARLRGDGFNSRARVGATKPRPPGRGTPKGFNSRARVGATAPASHVGRGH